MPQGGKRAGIGAPDWAGLNRDYPTYGGGGRVLESGRMLRWQVPAPSPTSRGSAWKRGGSRGSVTRWPTATLAQQTPPSVFLLAGEVSGKLCPRLQLARLVAAAVVAGDVAGTG